jgi:hypothetical protein
LPRMEDLTGAVAVSDRKADEIPDPAKSVAMSARRAKERHFDRARPRRLGRWGVVYRLQIILLAAVSTAAKILHPPAAKILRCRGGV